MRLPCSTITLPSGDTMSNCAISPCKRSAISSTSKDSSPLNTCTVSKKVAKMSAVFMPMARKIMVAKSLRRRSIRAYTKSFTSNSKSSHEPRYGMMRALYSTLPLECDLPLSWSKNTPGERCNCDTITRSVPLMMNVPFSVINGISPM
ncbi:Uncharacterised protein [Moraxella caviae]|nr:Uncharacterised protein [Moraxella caviae]